jgi:hypothetical protein
MEFLILLELCVLIIAGVAWVDRRRPEVEDPSLAARAYREARPTRCVGSVPAPPDQSGGGVSF